MAQIDALFEFLADQGGYELLIPADDNCHVTDSAGTHPMNRVMSAPEVTGILLEALPDALRRPWSDGEGVEFTRRTDAGEFHVSAEHGEEGPRIRLTHTPSDYVERLSAAARDAGASELLLGEGAPALVRRSGYTERLKDAPVIPAGTLAAFLRQVCPNPGGDALPPRFLTTLAGGGRARLTSLWGQAGPAVAVRLLPDEASPPVGLPGTFRDLLHQRTGLILVAAPPGQGLTSLLTGLLQMVATERTAHIVSLEEFVEIPVVPEDALLTRRPLGPGFRREQAIAEATAMQPELLFVDEIAEPAALRACLDAARDGSLIVAGCRGATVSEALERLLAAVAPETRTEMQGRLAETLRGAVAQTLCRDVEGNWLAARDVLISTAASSDSIRFGRLDEVADGIEAVGFSLDDALVRLVIEGKVAPADADACAGNRRRVREEAAQRLRRDARAQARQTASVTVDHAQPNSS